MKTIREVNEPEAIPQGDRVLIVSEGSIKVALDDVASKNRGLGRFLPRLSVIVVLVAAVAAGCLATDLYCMQRSRAEMSDLVASMARASDARVEAVLGRIESEMGDRDTHMAQQVDDMRTQIQQLPRSFNGEILALRERLVKTADVHAPGTADDSAPLTIRLRPNNRFRKH